MEKKDDFCINCKAINSYVIDMHNGELVCTNCGFVAEESIIDDTYEKRNFGSDNGGNRSESRIGGPMKAGEGNNLGSNLIKINKDGNAIRAKSGGGSYNQSPTERNYEEINRILGNKDVAKSVIEGTNNKRIKNERKKFQSHGMCYVFYSK